MNKATDLIQEMSADTAGKISIGIGGGGTTIQIITEYTSLFILFGNAMLVVAGLFLVTYKIRERWKK
tara:strand:- start:1951 stop:2151 length:201 start_codon:yes stop_codon:yes gene_type:complete